ncbi:MAG: hypothetical protein K9L82_05420 [Chromatiaceae bacterium]|nr:hypothetical protein [Chromatiaceae bacterium]MCF8015858.1 hypothetical protein [Chromatiaceae bacterium]
MSGAPQLACAGCCSASPRRSQRAAQLLDGLGLGRRAHVGLDQCWIELRQLAATFELLILVAFEAVELKPALLPEPDLRLPGRVHQLQHSVDEGQSRDRRFTTDLEQTLVVAPVSMFELDDLIVGCAARRAGAGMGVEAGVSAMRSAVAAMASLG